MHIRYTRNLTRGSGQWGVGLILFWTLFALAAPLLLPHDPAAYAGAPFAAPSPDHWLGTNDVGQDVLAQLAAGARTALAVSAGASILAVALGTLLGAGSALAGGLTERLTARVLDVFLVIPPVLAALLAAAYLQPGPGVLALLLAAFFWPSTGRLTRAQALLLKESGAVLAARTFGAGWRHLFFRHILPDLWPVMLAALIHDARRAVFMEASLAFLGIGDPTTPSWGKMIQQALAFTYMDVWQWWLVAPGAAVSSVILGFALCGAALEQARMTPVAAAGESDGAEE